MRFSSRLSLSALIELCRVLRHYLGAGLTLRDVFAQQAKRGSSSVRPVAGRIARTLRQGGRLEDALEAEQHAFPPLFLALASVAEQTGMLPEIFQELEEYYQRIVELRRQFLGRIAWPVLQLVLAIGVIALVILLLGILPMGTGLGGKPYDPLGLGLRGLSGALIFLGVVVGIVLGLLALWLLFRRSSQGRADTAVVLLALPVLGPCLRSLALARFCLALHLTTETGMPISRALELSLRATNNQAFEARTNKVLETVRKGEDLTTALTRARVFPEEFLRVLEVGEQSGRLSEVLAHQGQQYHEESSRRLGGLTALASYGVWLVVGAIIIVAIFRLFSSYLNLLNFFP